MSVKTKSNTLGKIAAATQKAPVFILVQSDFMRAGSGEIICGSHCIIITFGYLLFGSDIS